MNEEKIRELLDRLFSLEYTSTYGSGYKLPIISKEHRTTVENVIRQWCLEFHDGYVGTLEAKCFAYEQFIKNSNFAPLLKTEQERVNNG